ncbi:hypothetical protein Xen7305DRAFT_00047020 [Xenococcus sp. PCC 7305]|uniref:DUF6825 family protein n=1 Tax=Xenococcus sp. PCC 7305 TaxID=102125 RepID=UPI0002AD1292|nr:hypothetical protein [Xenococcus sp. PCC 7305]ELS04965.1 hypothetical protein Xen7305DRAFT_00047020 [Xenococcus sp. PCC 7305]
MSNPVVDAFFLGRAFAEVLSEKLEGVYTQTVNELGKFDAEQREQLRQFIEEVQTRAQQADRNTTTTASRSTTTSSNTTSSGTTSNDYNFNAVSSPGDLQTMLDQLRAEIASLRAELKKYRNP